MQQAIWKLTALAAVVGIGVLVVVQAQRGITTRQQEAENDAALADGETDVAPPAGDDDRLARGVDEESLPPAQEEPDSLFLNDDGTEPVPAAVKTSGTTRPSSRARHALADDDPFSAVDADDADADVVVRDKSDVVPLRTAPRLNASRRMSGADTETEASTGAGAGPRLRLSGLEENEPPVDQEESLDQVEDSGPPQLLDSETRPARGLRSLADDEDDVPSLPDDDERPSASGQPDGITDASEDAADFDSGASPVAERSPPRRKPATPLMAAPEEEEAAVAADFDGGTNRSDSAPAADGHSPALDAALADDDAISAPPERSRADSPSAPTEDNDAADFRLDSAPDEHEASPPSPVHKPATRRDREGAEASPPPRGQTRSAVPAGPRPRLTISKTAPPTAVLGQPMVYDIIVRNAGEVAARKVVVEDAVPAAFRIDGSIPQAQLADRKLSWQLGALAPGESRRISVRVIPQEEGTLGSVATVSFARDDGGLSGRASAPRLKLEVSAPRQAATGAEVPFRFQVANVGAVAATNVLIRYVIPAGLKHPEGDDLEYLVGPLAAGESKEVELVLTAAQSGKTVNRVILTADDNVSQETRVDVEVVGAILNLERTGPRRLHPGKSGVYMTTVTNPGSSAATGVRIVETIPPGLEFADASDGGRFDPARNNVTWLVDRLEPGAFEQVTIRLKSVARGAQISVVRAAAESGASGETAGTIHVAGMPALTIDTGETPAVIETGEQMVIPIRVLNRGTDTATEVAASVILPPGLELVAAKAPVEYRVVSAGAGRPIAERGRDRAGTELRFAPLSRLEPRAELLLELTLRARHTGTARLQMEAHCEQVDEPVRREELTTVTPAAE